VPGSPTVPPKRAGDVPTPIVPGPVGHRPALVDLVAVDEDDAGVAAQVGMPAGGPQASCPVKANRRTEASARLQARPQAWAAAVPDMAAIRPGA
jgi:hypothetical protein